MEEEILEPMVENEETPTIEETVEETVEQEPPEETTEEIIESEQEEEEPKVYHYIKLGIGNDDYIDLDDTLKEDMYDNLGTTLEDYYNGKFVLLTDEQYAFHVENPEAAKQEVFEMELIPPVEPTEEELLNEAKAKKDTGD